MPYFLHDSIRFYYELAGNGPPFVLSHAIGRNTTQLHRYIGDLPGYRMIRWDARGHGRTEPLGPEEKLNFSCFAQDLEGLLDYLKIKRAIVGGISMGAATTATLCCRRPARVAAAILIRPAWTETPRPPSLEALELIGQLLRQCCAVEARERFLLSQEFLLLREGSPLAAKQALCHFEEPRAAELAACFYHIPAATPVSSWTQLNRCTMPILVVGSKNDPFHPLDVASKWVDHLPNAHLAIVPSSYDDPQQHAQHLQDAVDVFLERHLAL